MTVKDLDPCQSVPLKPIQITLKNLAIKTRLW